MTAQVRVKKRVESVGKFRLTLELDADDRVVSARSGGATLTVDWGKRTGALAADDGSGSERWSRGHARGSWADVPDGHEAEIDRKIPLDAWVKSVVNDMRHGVFFQPGPARSTPAVLRSIWKYAQRHDVLLRSQSNPGARTWARALARVVDDKELKKLIAFLDHPNRREYLAYAKDGAGKKRAQAFAGLFVVDGVVHQAARAEAAAVYARVTKRALGAGDVVKKLNELAHKLLSVGDKKVDAVLAVTERVILSIAPADEWFDASTSQCKEAATDELAWRVLEIEHHTLSGDSQGVQHHAARALLLEDLLESMARA